MLFLIPDKIAPLGYIYPDNIGRFIAILLSQEDYSVYNKAKYIFNRLEDITGKQIIKLAE